MHWYQRLRDNGGGFEQQFLETASCCQNCGEISWQENPSWPDKHITRKNSPWYYCIHSVVIANRWWRHFSFRYAILLRIGTVVCIFPLAAFRSPILTRNFWKSPWKMWHNGNTWASPPKKTPNYRGYAALWEFKVSHFLSVPVDPKLEFRWEIEKDFGYYTPLAFLQTRLFGWMVWINCELLLRTGEMFDPKWGRIEVQFCVEPTPSANNCLTLQLEEADDDDACQLTFMDCQDVFPGRFLKKEAMAFAICYQAC